MASNPAGLKLAEATTTTSGTAELRRLSTLLEISQTLSAGAHQKTALHQVLNILERHHSLIRSTVVRHDENGNLIHEPTKQLIRELLKNLVDWTRRISPALAREASP